jgi:hypothetical protein
LFGTFAKTIQTDIASENFIEKNYTIKGYQIAQKSVISLKTPAGMFYELQNKENQIGNFESLVQNRFGTSFSYAGEKQITLNGEVSFYQNKFNGNEFSAVGFQMLEGLQTGQNITWRLLLQKKITQFLDVNFNYQGRKSDQANHSYRKSTIKSLFLIRT